MRPELPSEVLTELRKKTGRERKDFGEQAGWTYHTQMRLEEGKQLFRRAHLDALMAAGWLKPGDEWCQRFENAIAYQAELELSGNGHEPTADSQESGAAETNGEIPPGESRADQSVKALTMTIGAAGWLGAPAAVGHTATAAACSRQIARIDGMTRLATAAMDQVSSTHTRAEEVVTNTLAVVDLFSDAIDDTSRAGSHTRVFHEQQKHRFLGHVGKIVADSDATILAQVEDGSAAIRKRTLSERIRDFFRDC